MLVRWDNLAGSRRDADQRVLLGHDRRRRGGQPERNESSCPRGNSRGRGGRLMNLRIVGPIDSSTIQKIGEASAGATIFTGVGSSDSSEVDALLAWEADIGDVVAALQTHRSLR